MKKLLENKVTLITGSSRGIGRSIATTFAEEGANVVITYFLNAEKSKDLARKIGAKLILPINVTDRQSVKKAFRKVMDYYGKFDILVNNAGINKPADFDKQSDDEWHEVLAVDLTGVFICCQEVLPYISNGGRILNIGSLSGEYGGPRTPSYAAAKAGVMALTHCLARFVAERNITVNCISPGIIQSQLTDETLPQSLKEKILPQILLGRFGTLDEVASVAAFLASEHSSYITAQTISVNGGAWVR